MVETEDGYQWRQHNCQESTGSRHVYDKFINGVKSENCYFEDLLIISRCMWSIQLPK